MIVIPNPRRLFRITNNGRRYCDECCDIILDKEETILDEYVEPEQVLCEGCGIERAEEQNRQIADLRKK